MNPATREKILERHHSSMFNPTDIQFVHIETNQRVYPQCYEDWGQVTFAFDIDHNLKWVGPFENAEKKFGYYLRSDVELKICPVCKRKVSVYDWWDVKKLHGEFLSSIDMGIVKEITENQRLLWLAKVHANCYDQLN